MYFPRYYVIWAGCQRFVDVPVDDLVDGGEERLVGNCLVDGENGGRVVAGVIAVAYFDEAGSEFGGKFCFSYDEGDGLTCLEWKEAREDEDEEEEGVYLKVT